MGDRHVGEAVGLGPVAGEQGGVGDDDGEGGAGEGEHAAGRRRDRPADAAGGADGVEGAELVAGLAPQQPGGHRQDRQGEQHAGGGGDVADDGEATGRVAHLDGEAGIGGELAGPGEVVGGERLLEVEEPAGPHRLEPGGVEARVGHQGAGARREVGHVDVHDLVGGNRVADEDRAR